MTWPIRHLTADDLDAFHSASLSPDATQHLQDCAECRALVERDRALVAMLEALPVFEPAPDFADRILVRAAVAAPVPLPQRVARRLPLAAAVAIGLGASIGWSILNRALLTSAIDRVTAGAARIIWETLATIAQTVSEQPWISGLAGSTGRLALAGTVLAIGYGGAMIALRRLLVLPSRAAPHAG